jgi:hypothetical protein
MRAVSLFLAVGGRCECGVHVQVKNVTLPASREIEGTRLSVIESARAAVVSYPDKTAQVGFVTRIGDPTPGRFSDYPIRVEVTNVSPLF